MASPLVEGLARHGFDVSWAATGASGIELSRVADAVILDLGLPDMDGLDVCREIRSRSDVPILIVSARGQEADRVKGLEIGADDYVVKPFSLKELAARLRANARRRWSPASRMTLGSLEVDRDRREAVSGGVALSLTPKEFDLLAVLLEEPGRVVPRSELYARVWDPIWVGSGKSLDVHAATLRRKLPPDLKVEAVRGIGYRMIAEEQV